jgi:hypothetical protein
MTQPYSAGSLSSTVDDLARWDEALYTDKLLKPVSLERAWTPYVLKNGKPTGYGYGWGVSKVRGRPSIEHSGGIFGFSTDAIRLPADHVYVAVLSNSDSPSTSPSFVAGKLAAIAIGDPYPERVPVRVDPVVLQRYVGVYKVDATTTRTVTVDAGRIYTQRSGGERVEIFAASPTEFFYDKSLTYLRFGVDPNGNVTEMRLHPDGVDEPQRAERVSAAVPPVPLSVKLDPALYDAYAGEYELAPNFVLTVTREGDHLMTQATGQSKIEVFPSSETEFFLKVVDARLTFVRSAEGKVDHLILHQGGRDMMAKKRN